MRRVLVAGVSTRAAAESAALAGFDVISLDAFGDLDQHAAVTTRVLPARFTAHAAARAARQIECDAVAYLSNFENHPNAVRALASGRALWGNAPAVLCRVRDPILLAATLGRRGFAVPAVHSGEPGTRNPEPGTLNLEPDAWLLKRLASGGGRCVRPWRRGTRVPRGCYLQALVDGVPASVVFVAASGQAVPIGVSRQLVGERAFGATGYQYCGSILTAAGDADHDRVIDNACRLSCVVTEEFDLVGVNGVDFIARGQDACAIEVNPRWSASMELVEHAYGLSVFGAHAAACADGVLPAFDLTAARRGARAVGKAVIFARQDVVVGDTNPWLGSSARPARSSGPAPPALEIRDVPRPGERIATGRPVCTVLASGSDSAACHAALVQGAARVYAQLAGWAREVA